MCYAIGLNGTGLENLELDSLGNDCTFYFLWNQKQKMTFVACEFLIKIMNCRTMHNFSVVSILGFKQFFFFLKQLPVLCIMVLVFSFLSL